MKVELHLSDRRKLFHQVPSHKLREKSSITEYLKNNQWVRCMCGTYVNTGHIVSFKVDKNAILNWIPPALVH